MSYVSLYRKYRSQTFSDLIGQDHVVRTLQNAIQTGRIAHSYLFTGPRGTGKTSSARLLAKALCCRSGPCAEPCNECDICTAITEGSCLDVYELDAASESGVEDIRESIVEAVDYKPAMARYKVFIIDEVHDLSAKAFDALLKTIEEPPEHIIFILATTEFSKVPPTIRSRCQKFEFHRGSMQDLIARLEQVAKSEGIETEPAAMAGIARMADGGYRDALTLLEQATLTTDGKVTLEAVYDQLGLVGEEAADDLLLAIRKHKVDRILEISSELTRMGRDPRSILESLLYRLADLTRAAYGVDSGGDATREASLHDMASHLGHKEILAIRSELAEAHKVIRDISIPRLWLESELIRISQVLQAPEQRPAAQIQQPATQAREPVAKPDVKAAPKGITAPTEAPKEVAAVVVTPVAEDADLDPASRLWAGVLRDVPPNTPISMKLQGSKAIELTESQLTVEVSGPMAVDWMSDPKRQGWVSGLVRKHGSEVTVRFIAGKNGKRPAPEATAVELPLEGKALHEAASEILRGQS